MTRVMASWFTLIHNKISALQFPGIHGKLCTGVKLEKLAYSPLMRQNEPLLFVKLQRLNLLLKLFTTANPVLPLATATHLHL